MVNRPRLSLWLGFAIVSFFTPESLKTIVKINELGASSENIYSAFCKIKKYQGWYIFGLLFSRFCYFVVVWETSFLSSRRITVNLPELTHRYPPAPIFWDTSGNSEPLKQKQWHRETENQRRWNTYRHWKTLRDSERQLETLINFVIQLENS